MHLHLPTVSLQKTLWSAALAAGVSLGIAPLTPVNAAEATPSVIGAFPAPPRGAGSGSLVKWDLGNSAPVVGHYGTPKTPSGNSFYVAYDTQNHRIYVPTVAGTTYVMNAKTLAPVSRFKTLPGGRVARIGIDHETLLVLSGKAFAVYALADHKQLFTVPVGGNALAIDKENRTVYIGGNMRKSVTKVSLTSGKIIASIPISGSGDLAMAAGKLFSANMKTGVMSVLDTTTGKIVRIKTDETDPAFSYRKIRAAKAGFMQLAVSPDQGFVYGVGFSGNILKFSSATSRYVGKIAIKVAPTGPNKLSGFTLVDLGTEAVVTIENLKTTALVRMSDGKILKTLPGTASNRWVALQP